MVGLVKDRDVAACAGKRIKHNQLSQHGKQHEEMKRIEADQGRAKKRNIPVCSQDFAQPVSIEMHQPKTRKREEKLYPQGTFGRDKTQPAQPAIARAFTKNER